MSKDQLPTRVAAYQNQCFETGQDGSYHYTGFRCPSGNPDCPLTLADGLEILDALNYLGSELELDHLDSARFSRTRTTYPEQVVATCRACHTQRHANDPSASRLPWGQ